MAPEGPGTLYTTVGRNRQFNPDLPGEAHPASDVGQHWIDLDLSLRFASSFACCADAAAGTNAISATAMRMLLPHASRI